MMSDSYSDVVSKEGTTWRVSSVKLALYIEKSMPFLPAFFKLIQIKKIPMKQDEKSGRWIMMLMDHKIQMCKAAEASEVSRTLAVLQRELVQLNNSMAQVQ